jgi:hypothetical protein
LTSTYTFSYAFFSFLTYSPWNKVYIYPQWHHVASYSNSPRHRA